MPNLAMYSLQKLKNRMKQFENAPRGWSSQRKERIKELLSKGTECVSSEESGDEKTLCRRPLMWIKRKYHKSLHHLDELHYGSLTKKGKQMYRTRVEGEPSDRPAPADFPDYLLATTNAGLNDSLDSLY